MINSRTLARPYARAAFEFASTANNVDAWLVMLDLSSHVVHQEPVIRKLKDPTLGAKEKAELLIALLADKVDESFSNFIKLLGEHERLTLLPVICELYCSYKLEADHVVDVEIETAYKLDDTQLQTITAALSKRLDRTVKATQTVNAALIGGITIHAGDMVIDSSIRGRLNQLTDAMNS